MTSNERQMLTETHAGVKVIEARSEDYGRRMDSVENTVYGNGREGVDKRLSRVETYGKIVWGLVLAIALVIGDRIISVAFGG